MTDTTEMTAEKHAALQRPFDPGQIGKLPRAGIQLDYVGHAQVTARLLEADPGWSWEPVAFDTDGLPAIAVEQNGRRVLWIRLTVCGVTRLGVGIVGGDKPEVEKELIGDALRNAAMRFGVALDLWAKGDLHGDPDGPPAPSPRVTDPVTADTPVDWVALGWDDKDAHDAALEQARAVARRLPSPHAENVKEWVKDEAGGPPFTAAFMGEWQDQMDALTVADGSSPVAPQTPVAESSGPGAGDDGGTLPLDDGRPFE